MNTLGVAKIERTTYVEFSFAVSRSTLKRSCRKQGIFRWPSKKGKKVKHSPSTLESLTEFGQNGERRISESNGNDISHSNVPPEQAAVAIAHKIHHVTTLQDAGYLTIKAKFYSEDRANTIKFQLPFSSGMVELRRKVAERLRLKHEMFDINYLDTDGDWVLIYCEEDLQDVIDISRSSKNNTVQMLVKLQREN